MIFYSVSMPQNSWSIEKTAYDPCPPGWKVPCGEEGGVWVMAMGFEEAFGIQDFLIKSGVNFSGLLGSDEMIYYPLAGYNSDNSPVSTGWRGYYLSSQMGDILYLHAITDPIVDPNYPAYDAGSVRCQKDE
jgi:hypothetical protein